MLVFCPRRFAVLSTPCDDIGCLRLRICSWGVFRGHGTAYLSRICVLSCFISTHRSTGCTQVGFSPILNGPLPSSSLIEVGAGQGLHVEYIWGGEGDKMSIAGRADEEERISSSQSTSTQRPI